MYWHKKTFEYFLFVKASKRSFERTSPLSGQLSLKIKLAPSILAALAAAANLDWE